MAIPLTAELLQNLMAASLDAYMKGAVERLDVQEKPLLALLERSSRPFTGGKDEIIKTVSFGPKPVEHGFQGDDVLQFSNPGTLKQVRTRWYNRHIGLKIGIEELQRNGLVIVDADMGMDVRSQAGAAAVQLANLFEEKLEDLRIGREESRNLMFWGDGTASPLDVPGIRYWVQDDPTIPLVVGGIDQGAVPEWRNRAVIGIVANQSNASQQVLYQTLQREWRQLTKYGRRPTVALAGSDFIEQLENEYAVRGQMFDSGFDRSDVEISKPGFRFNGIRIQYDPTLDDIGRSKYCYFLNIGRSGIMKLHMDGWKDRKHYPARPEDRFTFYHSLTTVDAMLAVDRRSSGVYSIA